jgi:hypothetical protein
MWYLASLCVIYISFGCGAYWGINELNWAIGNRSTAPIWQQLWHCLIWPLFIGGYLKHLSHCPGCRNNLIPYATENFEEFMEEVRKQMLDDDLPDDSNDEDKDRLESEDDYEEGGEQSTPVSTPTQAGL